MNKRFEDLEEFIRESARHFSGSLLTLVRWSRSGGTKDYLLFTDLSCFEEFCRNAPRSTNILVFSETPPPLRIEPEPEDIEKLQHSINENKEWLVVEAVKFRDTWTHQAAPYNFVGQYRCELEEERKDITGQGFYFFSEAPSWEVDPYFEIFIENLIGIY